MIIALGSDELGLSLKENLFAFLTAAGHEPVDFGVGPGETTDYPDIGHKVAVSVAKSEIERGILICGTGIGMNITANKVRGIRAAVGHDLYSVQRSVLSNNAQILCLGALVIGPSLAQELVSVWMGLRFVECASSRKIAKISEYERGSFQ